MKEVNNVKVTIFLEKDIICGILTHTGKQGICIENIDHENYKHFKSLFINKDKIILIGYEQ